MGFYGRTVIYSDFSYIDESNVVDALYKALPAFQTNQTQIEWLYNYFKGNQPILNRIKEVRSEINNKVVENHANEIVTFKTGYLIGEPIQYVNYGQTEVSEDLNLLNRYMNEEHKPTRDAELANWFHICGTSYRMALPDGNADNDDAPFEIFTLDPQEAFVVYSNSIGHRPLMGVYVTTIQNVRHYHVYTDHAKYEIVNREIIDRRDHILGMIPIIEYPLNKERIGAFEIVIPLLNAINTTASNRLDGIEQFVQALFVLKGVEIESEDFQRVKKLGGIQIPKEGDIDYLVQELNQMETQTLVDYMYQTVLVIVGMPNRNGGSSTSDTGAATIMRDGWQSAEARAKLTETTFDESEMRFLRLILNIVNTYRDIDLRLSTIEIKFTRRNYQNLLEKVEALNMILNNDKIHPKLGFELCGAFTDPEYAYKISAEYYEAQQQKALAELNEINGVHTDDV